MKPDEKFMGILCPPSLITSQIALVSSELWPFKGIYLWKKNANLPTAHERAYYATTHRAYVSFVSYTIGQDIFF